MQGSTRLSNLSVRVFLGLSIALLNVTLVTKKGDSLDYPVHTVPCICEPLDFSWGRQFFKFFIRKIFKSTFG